MKTRRNKILIWISTEDSFQ